ncbi:copper-(or silver)-translocating P-type ATPase [Anaerovirgula multivorans]|uniref:Cd(2+)-exporting ATPase n=1 Tax=Anaerovirgula multivorans TaxID=312168 RepID=A0A239BIU1_9FIRM|nr:cation-translocating P-type ATPase [Anaerovirgula multivorans]SNS06963.1 copper-(or silver)-translocating P-type ATPase [Anaerovirgula multivorans]
MDNTVKEINKDDTEVEFIHRNKVKSNEKTSIIRKYFLEGEGRTIALTSLSGVFLVISWFGWLNNTLPFDVAWFSILISGTPILHAAVKGFLRSFDIKAGVLVSIALIASIIIGEYFAAGEIAFIMMLGEILEDRTVAKAKKGIKKLIQLSPEMGRIRTPLGEKSIAVEEIKVGDLLLIKPGEAIPVDGVIINGKSTINQSIITGESMPIDKAIGDEVFVGTLNQLGVIEVKATKVGEDTSLSKLIRLVKEAEEKKAPVVRLADKMATVIVPLALIFSIITYMVTRDITRAVTILVVFCPCALVLATPTAIMAGIGNAARKGILIKSGEAMENLGKVDTITFDKTGTITYGRPEVIDIISLHEDCTEDGILEIAAIAEKFSEHPLGKAIYKKAKEKSLDIPDPLAFDVQLGEGIISRINDEKVIVGNVKLLKENKVKISKEEMKIVEHHQHLGKTVMGVAVEERIIGLINVADQVKNNVEKAISDIKNIGINNILILTGDNKNAASWVAAKVGIEKVYAEQLPEGKVKVIASQIKDNKKVCMVGDGINDAPAFARADVGIAMAALGADVAVETADIALMSDDISKIPELFVLTKKVLRTIKVNIGLSLTINFVAILLAALGIINPVMGALIHNLGSILVVMSSATLIKYKAII